MMTLMRSSSDTMTNTKRSWIKTPQYWDTGKRDGGWKEARKLLTRKFRRANKKGAELELVATNLGWYW